MRLYRYIMFFFFVFSIEGYSQHLAQYREYEKDYVTYSYSDPDPIPVMGKIYPYFRYDGYTTNGVKKKWKIVELENEFLRICIFPQIGGKIWSVYDKKAKQEMFYGNDVVKFRDVSLRGPWTSGGIEFNYGVVGHAPTCSFPVNYLVRINSDRSVSCIIGVLDLLTRTRWSVEINLPVDKAWFTTTSFYHNATGLFQPYYNWVNTGVKARKDLHLTYPGTHIITHSGTAVPWPIDQERNKDLSIWRENDFIGSKSYHIVGSSKPYFGAYWENDDFGVLHYSSRDQKVGKKMFSWALSDQGDIWEELLTDGKGQYVEMQSGRLFNQNMVTSSLTPYKQIQFSPYASDTWVEYWFPYHGIGKVDDVSLYGVSHVDINESKVILKYYPLQDVTGSFEIYDIEGQLCDTIPVVLRTSEPFCKELMINDQVKIDHILLNGEIVWTTSKKELHRPVKTVPDFNWRSAYGNYLRGRDLIGMRLYSQAEKYIRKSLLVDPNFVPSLVEMAALYYYKMDYDSAYVCALKALSIDTYDSRANYEYGLAAFQLGKKDDARDGFELATLAQPLRNAAYTELAKLYFVERNLRKAYQYASKALVNNALNIEALQLMYLCNIIDGKDNNYIEKQICKYDPLNPMLLFESFYSTKSDASKIDFIKKINSDLSQQQYLELAVYYYSLDMVDRAKEILSILPEPNAEMLYWQAYLHRDSNKYKHFLLLAENADATFVFPFREESKKVFEWASIVGNSWKSRYYLALLEFSRNNINEAFILLKEVGDKANFSPCYVLCGDISKDIAEKEANYKLAIQYSLGEWRYVHRLVRFYISQKQYKKALRILEPFYDEHKSHFPTGSLYVRSLLYCGKVKQAEDVLSKTYILPFEGEKSGRLLYLEIKLKLALQFLDDGKAKYAIKKIQESFLWPRNIGVGKPYDEIIDDRLENWLLALSYLKLGRKEVACKLMEKVAYDQHSSSSINALLQALALFYLHKEESSELMFEKWVNSQKNHRLISWGKSFYQENRGKSYPFDYDNLYRIIGLISGAEDLRLF